MSEAGVQDTPLGVSSVGNAPCLVTEHAPRRLCGCPVLGNGALSDTRGVYPVDGAAAGARERGRRARAARGVRIARSAARVARIDTYTHTHIHTLAQGMGRPDTACWGRMLLQASRGLGRLSPRSLDQGSDESPGPSER